MTKRINMFVAATASAMLLASTSICSAAELAATAPRPAFVFPSQWTLLVPAGKDASESDAVDNILADASHAAERLAARLGAPGRSISFDAEHQLDLAPIIRDGKTGTACLLAEITLDQDWEIVLGAGSVGELRILVNGQCVFDLPAKPRMAWVHPIESSILDHSLPCACARARIMLPLRSSAARRRDSSGLLWVARGRWKR